MNQRRAWQVVGQLRATQRYVPEAEAEEERLRARLRAFSRKRPCAGYRTACGKLRQEGLRVNPKRVQRLWREEGLKVATAARRVATRRATDGGYGICAWSMSSCVRAWRWKCGGGAGVAEEPGRGTALHRSGRGSAPPSARQRGNPTTMNQNSHSNWLKHWGLATRKNVSAALIQPPSPQLSPRSCLAGRGSLSRRVTLRSG